MRPNEPYHIKISTQMANAARSAIRNFSMELGKVLEPAPRMSVPIIAYSSTGINWGQMGEVDTSNKFEIVINIAELTFGKVESLKPKELQLLLFNEHVGEDVADAMMWAMIWTGDVERKGANEFNQNQVHAYMSTLFDLFNQSLDMLLAHDQRH